MKCYVDSTLTQTNKKTCQGYRDETLNGISFNVMTMVEGLILPFSPFLRKLCFARGRKRHLSGSYGVRMTKLS